MEWQKLSLPLCIGLQMDYPQEISPLLYTGPMSQFFAVRNLFNLQQVVAFLHRSGKAQLLSGQTHK